MLVSPKPVVSLILGTVVCVALTATAFAANLRLPDLASLDPVIDFELGLASNAAALPSGSSVAAGVGGGAAPLSASVVVAADVASPPAASSVINVPANNGSGHSALAPPVDAATAPTPTPSRPGQRTTASAPSSPPPAPTDVITIDLPVASTRCVDPGTPYCQFTVRGTFQGSRSTDSERLVVFVNPTAPRGAGLYLQIKPATIFEGFWSQDMVFVGSGDHPARDGDLFELTAVLLAPNATVGGMAISSFVEGTPVNSLQDVGGVLAVSSTRRVVVSRPVYGRIDRPAAHAVVGSAVTTSGNVLHLAWHQEIWIFVTANKIGRIYGQLPGDLGLIGDRWVATVNLGDGTPATLGESFTVSLVALERTAGTELRAWINAGNFGGLTALPNGAMVLDSIDVVLA